MEMRSSPDGSLHPCCVSQLVLGWFLFLIWFCFGMIFVSQLVFFWDEFCFPSVFWGLFLLPSCFFGMIFVSRLFFEMIFVSQLFFKMTFVPHHPWGCSKAAITACVQERKARRVFLLDNFDFLGILMPKSSLPVYNTSPVISFSFFPFPFSLCLCSAWLYAQTPLGSLWLLLLNKEFFSKELVTQGSSGKNLCFPPLESLIWTLKINEKGLCLLRGGSGKAW